MAILAGRRSRTDGWSVQSLPPLCAREDSRMRLIATPKEVERLFGVMEKRLSDRPYLAGTYSIADIASFPWARTWKHAGPGHNEISQRRATGLTRSPRVRRSRGVLLSRKPIPRASRREIASRKFKVAAAAQAVGIDGAAGDLLECHRAEYFVRLHVTQRFGRRVLRRGYRLPLWRHRGESPKARDKTERNHLPARILRARETPQKL